MPFLYGLLLVLQIACVVHMVRSGRPYWWAWIVIFVPGIGVAAYLITQVLPDLQNDPRARRAARGLAKRLDPEKDLRRLRTELERADTVQNRLRLGAEFLELGAADEAETIFRESLRGMHATDPDILLALAKAQSAQGKAGETIATLDTLKAANPGFKSPDGHLLYARSLEGLERTAEALAEYDVLEDSFPGEEARVRKAELLRVLGRDADARVVLEKVIERARIAPDFYRKAQREWVDRAKQMLRG
ncbi:MAG: hypothetical protein IPK27_21685 [Rhodanobacteraceae bacterium]|nr:hypothetical protein [Rhodanobacteraceae bacterium]